MTIDRKKPSHWITRFCFLLLLLVGACTTISRDESARSLALTAHLTKKEIATAPFMLTSFERIQSPGGEVHLYIEGDGLAWVSRHTPSLDPTPKNPVSLKLAVQDASPNVIYLARPCQYSKLTTAGACPQKYWTSHRFAPEVMASMNMALDEIKSRYGITGFHLTGFSGGANVAALLTEQRNDVLSLRTVAGNLDHVLLHQIHGVSQIPNSLNAKNKARTISHIPQYHFIGEEDKVVLPAIARSFISASGQTHCIRSKIIPGVSHGKGWPDKWPALLKYPLDCRN